MERDCKGAVRGAGGVACDQVEEQVGGIARNSLGAHCSEQTSVGYAVEGFGNVEGYDMAAAVPRQRYRHCLSEQE